MATYDYWEKREKDWQVQNIKDDAVFDKELEKHMQQALTDIQNDINRFYANYAKSADITMDEAVKRVNSFDVESFSKEAAGMVKDEDFSVYANERLKLYNATMRINRLEYLKAQIGLDLSNMTMKQQKALEDKLGKAYVDELKRQSGILGANQVKYSRKQIEDVINASFQNATWSTRLWANQDELKSLLDNLLTNAMVQGLGPIELARKIQELFMVRKYIAERLARTEMARVQDTAQRESIKHNGYQKLKWIAEPSACKVCLEIASTDGGIYDIDDAPLIPVHPNCRCSVAAYMDHDEESNDLIKEKNR